MGQSAAETVREIEDVRRELDGKVRELEHRLPAPAALVKRVAGIAFGGGLSGTLFWFAVRRVRNRRGRAQRKLVRDERKPARDDRVTVIELAVPALPPQARPWLYGAAAVWTVVRLGQIRATRRTNALLAQRRA